jgi:hypothetical protein
MITKLKALGLALVAVFAMSVVVASGAQATAGTITTDSPLLLRASQHHSTFHGYG